jgi:hypothetical protein
MTMLARVKARSPRQLRAGNVRHHTASLNGNRVTNSVEPEDPDGNSGHDSHFSPGWTDVRRPAFRVDT